MQIVLLILAIFNILSEHTSRWNKMKGVLHFMTVWRTNDILVAKLGLGKHLWNVRPVDSLPLLKVCSLAIFQFRTAFLTKLVFLCSSDSLQPRPSPRQAVHPLSIPPYLSSAKIPPRNIHHNRIPGNGRHRLHISPCI